MHKAIKGCTKRYACTYIFKGFALSPYTDMHAEWEWPLYLYNNDRVWLYCFINILYGICIKMTKFIKIKTMQIDKRSTNLVGLPFFPPHTQNSADFHQAGNLE